LLQYTLLFSTVAGWS